MVGRGGQSAVGGPGCVSRRGEAPGYAGAAQAGRALQPARVPGARSDDRRVAVGASPLGRGGGRARRPRDRAERALPASRVGLRRDRDRYDEAEAYEDRARDMEEQARGYERRAEESRLPTTKRRPTQTEE